MSGTLLGIPLLASGRQPLVYHDGEIKIGRRRLGDARIGNQKLENYDCETTTTIGVHECEPMAAMLDKQKL